MGIPIPVEAKLDERSAIAAADRAQRVFADAGKDAGKSFSDSFATGARDSEQAVKKIGERASDAYDKARDSAGQLRAEEEKLQSLRDRGARNDQVVSQAERVEKARRAEVRAIRDATNAIQEYEQASESAGRNSGTSFLGGLQGAVGGAASSGQDMASEFASGFAGASVLTRLGAAGGPIGLALAGLATLGFAGGKLLAGGISDGLASLQVKDLFQARLRVDDATMARLGAGAAQAYVGGYGDTLEANLGAMQFGIQGRLVSPNAGADEIQQLIEKTQTLSSIMGEDPQAIVRGTRGFIDSGLVSSYQQAFDLIAAVQAKGGDLSGDLLDTAEEYGTSFRELGLTGADAFGLINQMVESGARNTDQAADGLKELAINLQDGSKLTAEALSALGFDAQDTMSRLSDGGVSAREAFGLILAEIQKVQDPVQRDQIGLALFKTKWEDMGKAIDGADLSTAASELGDIDGALDDANGKMSEHVNQWSLLGREIDVTFGKFKEWLADSAIGTFFNQTVPGAFRNFLDTSDPMSNFRDSLPADGFTPPAPGDGLLGDAPVVGPVPGGWGANGTLPAPAFAPGAGTFVDPRINASAPALPGAPIPAPSATDGGPARIAPVPMTPESEKDGEKPKTVIDPSLFSLDSVPIGSMPGAGQQQPPGMLPMPGVAQPQGVPTWNPEQQAYGSTVVDPQRVFDAETSLISQRQSVESARERLLVMEAEGTATAAELNAARTSVITTERAYISNQQKLLEAQQGTWKKANDAVSGAMGDLKSVFAPLDEDFGISGGIPGIVENLTKLFGNMALAGVIGSSPTLQGAALQLANGQGGAGLFGIGGNGTAPSAMGPAALQPGLMPTILQDTGSVASGPQSRHAAALIEQMWGDQLKGKIGGSRDNNTAKGTHDAGLSIDIPIAPDQMELGDQIRDYLQANAGALGLDYTIWRDQGINADGSPGFTTPGHQNHIDAKFNGQGGTGSPLMPQGSGGTLPGLNTSGATPVFVVNMGAGGMIGGPGGPAAAGAAAAAAAGVTPAGPGAEAWRDTVAATVAQYGAAAGIPQSQYQNWTDAIVKQIDTESKGDALAQNPNDSNGKGGTQHVSGLLQYLPESYARSGGELTGRPFMDPIGQIAGALAAPRNPDGSPSTSAAGSIGTGQVWGPVGFPAAGGGASTLPPIPAGAGGQGYMGLGGPPAIGGPGGVPPQTSGGGGGGVALGGMAMDGLMASTAALDVMAPGAGQAAKVGIQLANRAIKYGSQVAGIGASGLMETFLPSGSPLGNFGNSWIGKLAGGIAGAKPALPNTAAKQSAPPNPNAQQGQQGAGTQVGTHIEKLEYNNNEATQGSGINDVARNLEATNSAAGVR